ncbi:MAG: hypothetical protein ABSE18_00550 [Minisyncoccia bacterium]|jgi:hypothetical protein
MPPTKLAGFKEQFPWAEKYASGPIYQVYVSRVEPDILNHGAGIFVKIMKYYEYLVASETSLEDTWFPVELYLLDKNGQTIDSEKKVHRRKHWYSLSATEEKEHYRITWVTSKITEGTVNTKLEELGERARDVRFVLSYCTRTKALILYKIPESLSLLEWVNRQRAMEREQFQRACETIDAEATA